MKKAPAITFLALLTTAALSLTVSLASADEYQPPHLSEVLPSADHVDLCYSAPAAPTSAADTTPQEGDFDPSRYEIVNPQDVPGEPVPAPCECGGEKVIYQISESGYIKGVSALCTHGLNGNAATNTIVYVVQCQACGQGEAFSRRVVLTQCNH